MKIIELTLRSPRIADGTQLADLSVSTTMDTRQAVFIAQNINAIIELDESEIKDFQAHSRIVSGKLAFVVVETKDEITKKLRSSSDE